jgi:hypothetical protein
MKSLVQALGVAVIVILTGFAASALASPPATVGGPIIAQYSGNSYGNSSSNSYGSTTRTSYRSYRGIGKLIVLVIVLICSGVGFLIRKMNGG